MSANKKMKLVRDPQCPSSASRCSTIAVVALQRTLLARHVRRVVAPAVPDTVAALLYNVRAVASMCLYCLTTCLLTETRLAHLTLELPPVSRAQ